MIKKLIGVAALCLVSMAVVAQHELTVHVTNASTGSPLRGSSVRISGTTQAVQTGETGHARLRSLGEGQYELLISHVGFETSSRTVSVPGTDRVEIALQPATFLAEEVIVQATRASENSATTYRNVSRAELERNNLGQDLPYLLDQTPSVVISSDAGTGIGYTGIRIRGSDATRINVTINGIPLNNPESMGTFLVNLPDLASSVENIQIQRGVGTSTNGAGAFGASLNIQTSGLRQEPYAELDNSVGSYNTIKNTVRLGTGLVGEQFSFDGRLSRIKSDGYIDRAFSDLKSFYLTGAWHGQNSLLRANVFSGSERTYQAWNGVPEEMLATNRRYNEFTYENQTDNYIQTHYQLHYSQGLTANLHLNAALHYTRGAGYYEEFREDDELENYGLADVILGGTTIATTDLVRRRWLDNDFFGGTYSLSYRPTSELTLSLGGAYNEYIGGHYGEVIWARYASDGELGDRYYEDEGIKKDFNIFGKAEYTWDALSLYADLQYRRVSYAFLGYDRNLVQLDQTDYLNFFNPKLGVAYQFDDRSQAYLSLAIANKEPIRDDYVESSVDSRPHPERLHNVELGYRLVGQKYRLGANAYGMFYKDQLIITGQINDVGELIRQNVADSYRIGLELDAQWHPLRKLSWAATVGLSDNTIRNFTEYVDLHDYYAQEAFSYDRTRIAMSPSLVASSEISYRPWPQVELALQSKHVSRQYLDNTTARERSIDPYFVNNLRAGYSFSAFGAKKIGLTLSVNNLFGEEYSSNGFTFGQLNEDGSRVFYNYYYPQATANFLLGLSLAF